MEALLVYLLGWFIWSIGYYVNEVYINRNIWSKKRLIIYKAISSGVVSWIGIIIVIAVWITAIIFSINDWIEEKLS